MAGQKPSEPFVVQEGPVWRFGDGRLEVALDEGTLGLTVTPAGCAPWLTTAGGDEGLVAAAEGDTRRCALTDAGTKSFEAYRTGWAVGVRARLGNFPGLAGLGITLIAKVDTAAHELVCEVMADESGAQVREIRWPRAFVLEQAGRANYTVFPTMAGLLLPSDWPEEASLDKVWPHQNMCFTRGMYMPWWGQVRGGEGYAAIIETPYDAGCALVHPPGGPTAAQPVWYASLGRLAYARSLRYAFLAECDHVALAKRYRRYAQGIGRWRSLTEKAAGNPRVERLHGGAIIHTGVMVHIQPESSYYNKEKPEANHHFTPFAQRAREIREWVSGSGIANGEVHLDGWGRRGYDNLHPDVLPPCPEAGGWEGMREVAKACEEMGWIFATHDNYRDFYFDAPSFDRDLCIRNLDGSNPEHATWYGGRQSILCGVPALGFLRRNLDGLAAGGVELSGIYLDVFAIAELDECANPEHPMTREECARWRGLAFSECRARGLVVSSEEPVDFALDRMDLVHHGPYAQHPSVDAKDKRQLGLACPLFTLVYHDAIVVPWSFGKGAWGIPPQDEGFLHCLLNGGIGYLYGVGDAERVRTAAALHKRVGWLEMTGHEYLDEAGRRQRSRFADGTTVEVDFDAGSYAISPALGE